MIRLHVAGLSSVSIIRRRFFRHFPTGCYWDGFYVRPDGHLNAAVFFFFFVRRSLSFFGAFLLAHSCWSAMK